VTEIVGSTSVMSRHAKQLSREMLLQGPREGLAEGASAPLPPLFFGAIEKIIMIKLENSLVSE